MARLLIEVSESLDDKSLWGTLDEVMKVSCNHDIDLRCASPCVLFSRNAARADLGTVNPCRLNVAETWDSVGLIVIDLVPCRRRGVNTVARLEGNNILRAGGSDRVANDRHAGNRPSPGMKPSLCPQSSPLAC